MRRDYEGQDCSIARALEVVGERWTLLIVRDAFFGLRRFNQFQESLGIARNVLTDRLNRLVQEGILERVRYSERPERYEYRLTPKGRDLQIVLVGLRRWGARHLSEKRPAARGRRRTRSRPWPRSCRRAANVLRPEKVGRSKCFHATDQREGRDGRT